MDVFANKHNEITSVIFNSNTNVILGIIGACMIYVALYTTKNTHDEDIKDYAKAGKQMMRRIMAEYGVKLDQLDDAERKKMELGQLWVLFTKLPLLMLYLLRWHHKF